MRGIARRVLRLFKALERLDGLARLVLRTGLGVMFLGGALHKATHLGEFVAYFERLRIPAARLQAPFVVAVELLGGAALILGLGARVASVMLAGTMVVALATAAVPEHHIRATWQGLLEFLYLPEWLLLCVLGWLAVVGPGRASLDHGVRARHERAARRRRPPGDPADAAPSPAADPHAPPDADAHGHGHGHAHAHAHDDAPARRAGCKRVVILGGGFGGVYAALHLEQLVDDAGDIEVVLINKENYFVFQPMLPEVISGTIGLLDVVTPIRRILRTTELHTREVESIDLDARTITTSQGFRPHPHVLEYDHLVLALGTVTDFRGLRGLPEHAMPFKNLADALQLRNHVIRALEEAAIEGHDRELRRQLLTFVVAGGGFSGVEVAAELNDFVRGVAEHYRSIDPSEIRVILLHAGERILPELSPKLGDFAQRILAERGVEIRLNTRLQAATGESAILADGEHLPTRTLVSTVPASPHPLLEKLALPKTRNGRLDVDEFLQVKGRADVWALGDCAMVPIAGTKDFAPPTAQHAIRQAQALARNIVHAVRGEGARKAFAFKGLGKMGSLGHRSAVADIFGLNISGFLAWFLWRTIYLMKMPGWGRRLKVAASWTLDLILPAELVQLRLTGSGSVSQLHFEPGQAVFQQGDLGDSIYIILSGEAEVVRSEAGVETVLARLGPGECFGEMALLNMATRNASVRCVSAMNALSLPKRDFAILAASLPDMRASFQRISEARARAARAVGGAARHEHMPS